MANISKLNRMIEKQEKKIAIHMEKIIKAKELKNMNKISKAKYYEIKNKHNQQIRELRNDIRRKKKARQMLMKKEKEEKEEKDKKKSFFF